MEQCWIVYCTLFTISSHQGKRSSHTVSHAGRYRLSQTPDGDKLQGVLGKLLPRLLEQLSSTPSPGRNKVSTHSIGGSGHYTHTTMLVCGCAAAAWCLQPHQQTHSCSSNHAVAMLRAGHHAHSRTHTRCDEAELCTAVCACMHVCVLVLRSLWY